MLDDAAAQGALRKDVSHLAQMGATGLLSLVEAKEFPEGFAAAIRGAGLEWVHLPIPDFGVPDTRFMEGWRAFDLTRRLREGESWAIHCRAGLGRTGTIAALLLVEGGASAADAIARIRREHDAAAIETRAQESFLVAHEQVRFALRQEALSDASPQVRAETPVDRRGGELA